MNRTRLTVAILAVSTLVAGLAMALPARTPPPAEPVETPRIELAPRHFAEPPPPPPVEAWTTGIENCDAYIAKVERYLRCEGVPSAAREAAWPAIQQMKDAWSGSEKFPPEAVKGAGDACLQASDALHQGALAMGCDI